MFSIVSLLFLFHLLASTAFFLFLSSHVVICVDCALLNLIPATYTRTHTWLSDRDLIFYYDQINIGIIPCENGWQESK